ncbi:ras and EF-hand domain-containing protein-like isoform X10 [Gallus gallus]|uniref:ras and EF-hand domain-containing protein-like isoform X10 n=1 Tax=Gallus gallus TaxID=9031 RepID=UPI001AE1B6CA|nr:ras and EF-hand domain-containing protein-like isoform X10 [Gallus gallus]
MKGRGRGAGVARLQQRLEDATQVNARGWGRLRAVPAEPTGLSPPGERAAAAQPAALRGRSVRAAGGAGAAAGGSLSAGPAAQKVALGAGGEARPRPRVVLWPCPAPGCPRVSAQGRPRAALRSWEGFAGKLCPLRRAANAGSRREAHAEPSARPPRPSATSPPSNPPVTPGVPELSQRFRHPEMGGTCGAGRTRAAPGVGLAVRMPFLRREQQALRELAEEHLAFTSYIRMLQSTNRILRESDGSLRSALLLGSCGGPEAPPHAHPQQVRADCSVCPWQSSASSEDSASPSNTSSQSSEDACSASPAQGTQDPQAGKVEGCCHPAQRCCKRKLSAFAPELAPSPQGSGMGEQPTAPSPVYRLVLAGDSGAGKSSFLLRLCRNEFRGDISSTLGVDFQVKELLVDGEQTTLQIWDTAGQESDTPGSRYRSIARSYFRKAHGVLLLYDISSQSSFLSVRQWIEDIEGAGTALPLMLVGNKSDLRAGLPEMVGVHTAHGQRLAMVSGCCRGQPLEAPSGPRLQPLSVQAHNCLFCETSAKDGTNVVEAVLHLARAVKRTAASGSGARLDLSIPAPRAAAGCCRA